MKSVQCSLVVVEYFQFLTNKVRLSPSFAVCRTSHGRILTQSSLKKEASNNVSSFFLTPSHRELNQPAKVISQLLYLNLLSCLASLMRSLNFMLLQVGVVDCSLGHPVSFSS